MNSGTDGSSTPNSRLGGQAARGGQRPPAAPAEAAPAMRGTHPEMDAFRTLCAILGTCDYTLRWKTNWWSNSTGARGRVGRSAFVAQSIRRALEDERRWDDIEAALGTIADSGHEWDDDPAAWVRGERRGDPRRSG